MSGEFKVKSVLTIKLEVKEPTFPVLCKNVDKNFTVLFDDYTCGTVVHSEDSSISVGKYEDSWYKWNDKKHWTVLPKGSTVTLTQ